MRTNPIIRLAFIFLLLLLAAIGCTSTQKPAASAPSAGAEDWQYHRIVDVDSVKPYVQTPPRDDVMIIDSRPKQAQYDKGHIPGSVSIPDSQFDKMTDRLPPEKEKLLVFYCGGYKCKLSHKSAERAIALGYKKVQVFSGGYPEWTKMVAAAGATAAKPMPAAVKTGKEEGSIDIATFEKIIAERPETILLIDVRDPDEFKSGSFKSAVNLPVDDLEAKVKTLPTDKPIVFVFATGARSGESYYMVKDMRPEVKDVYYLEAELTFNTDGSYKIKKAE